MQLPGTDRETAPLEISVVVAFANVISGNLLSHRRTAARSRIAHQARQDRRGV